VSVAERMPPDSTELPLTFVCSHCSRYFASAADFKEHLAQHNGNGRVPSRPAPPARIPATGHELTFACSHCGATFANRWGLRAHALEHGAVAAPEWEPPAAHVPPVTPLPSELSARRLERPARVLPGPWVSPARSALRLIVSPAVRRSDQVRLGLTGLFASSLALYGLGLYLSLPNLALAGTLCAVFFGVGTAPLQFARAPGLAVRLGVAGLVGLSTIMLCGVVMVLEPLWDPFLWAAIVAGVAGAIHLAAVPRALRDRHRARLRAVSDRPRRGLRRAVRALLTPSALLTIAGTAMWLGATITTGHITPGIAGFLPHITPVWYAGLATLLVAVALARGKREIYVALAVVSLAVALTLTPALIYAMPRAQTAGRHIEIVQFILRQHHLSTGMGIYATYSAFFAGIAWLCRVAGVSDSLGLATFWPVLIGLVILAELRFLFGRLTRSDYRCWAAMLIVVLVNAIQQDYFSPQSVGFVIGLGVYALVIVSSEPPVINGWSCALLLWLAGCAMAATHELSPYVVGGVLVVLAVFGRARPRWSAAAVLVPAALWLGLNRNVVSPYFSLADIWHLTNFLAPQQAAANGLARQSIVAFSSYALLLGVLVLIAAALVGFARHRHEAWAWAFMASAGLGLIFVAFNPYGNEGIYRATLFGIPWLALLALRAVERPPSRMGLVALAAMTFVLLGTFLVANFGMNASSVMRGSDLTALRVFESRAPAGSYLVSVGYGEMPNVLSYFSSDLQTAEFSALVGPAKPTPRQPVAGDVAAFTRRYENLARTKSGAVPSDLYAVWSPVLSEYSFEYGLLSKRQSAAWRSLMLASPDWRLVYSADGTLLFRLSGGATTGSATATVSSPSAHVPRLTSVRR
jgi:hypothetical protein